MKLQEIREGDSQPPSAIYWNNCEINAVVPNLLPKIIDRRLFPFESITWAYSNEVTDIHIFGAGLNYFESVLDVVDKI